MHAHKKHKYLFRLLCCLKVPSWRLLVSGLRVLSGYVLLFDKRSRRGVVGDSGSSTELLLVVGLGTTH